MVNTDKLRGIFRENGTSIANAAKMIGISEATMHRKLNSGIFGTDEIDKLIDAFNIKNPIDIFFAQR